MSERKVKCLRCGTNQAVTREQRKAGKASRHCPSCKKLHNVLFVARRALVRLGHSAMALSNLGVWRHCENAGIELEELEREMDMIENEEELELGVK